MPLNSHGRIGFVTITSFLLLLDCQRATPPAPPSATKIGKPRYVRKAAGNDVVIVFVHGVFGDGDDTWRNRTSNTYWPELITTDDTFKDADVFVHSFASPFLNRAYSIDELIEDMREVFEKEEIFNHKEVVFLCHSMGGLIVRGYLKRYQYQAPKVNLIYFYSTPTAGSHITEMAKFLTRNPQVKGMLPVAANEYLKSMQKDWRAIPVRILSKCAYETKDTYGFRIVDEESATTLCDGPVDPLDYDHMEIVKPTGLEERSYSRFQIAYKTRPGVPLDTKIIQQSILLTVACGATKESHLRVAYSGTLSPEQRIVDAIVALQAASNLKEESVFKVSVSQTAAEIQYRIVGLDRDPGGNCRADGIATVSVSFIVNQPSKVSALQWLPDSLWSGADPTVRGRFNLLSTLF